MSTAAEDMEGKKLFVAGAALVKQGKLKEGLQKCAEGVVISFSKAFTIADYQRDQEVWTAASENPLVKDSPAGLVLIGALWMQMFSIYPNAFMKSEEMLSRATKLPGYAACALCIPPRNTVKRQSKWTLIHAAPCARLVQDSLVAKNSPSREFSADTRLPPRRRVVAWQRVASPMVHSQRGTTQAGEAQ